MQRRLTRHPQSLGGAALRISVEARRDPDDCATFSYFIAGDIEDVILPAPAAPERTDGLWRTTCFEVFLRLKDGPAYTEFNFSPSGQWAAYLFDRYRDGMRPLETAPPQQILRSGGGGLSLTARINLSGLELGAGKVAIGLAAIIEGASGAISYWALAHPSGRPDFHNADCFAGELDGGTAE
jgi:hypothetical protein